MPIFKSGDPMDPSNYHTILIGRIFGKLYTFILEHDFSRWAVVQSKWEPGLAGFHHPGYWTLWRENIIMSILKSGDASHYRTIMMGHTLANCISLLLSTSLLDG